jgi:hypothetical protein
VTLSVFVYLRMISILFQSLYHVVLNITLSIIDEDRYNKRRIRVS